MPLLLLLLKPGVTQCWGLAWEKDTLIVRRWFMHEEVLKRKQSGQVRLYPLRLQCNAKIKMVRQRPPWGLLRPHSNTSVMLESWGKRLAAPANSLPGFSPPHLQKNSHHAMALSWGTDHRQRLRLAEALVGKHLRLARGIPAMTEQSHCHCLGM